MTDNNNSNNSDNESKPDLRFNKELIEMRRAKVLELLSKGYSQAEVSRSLGTSKSLICLDIQKLKTDAQESLQTQIQETIPFEYQRSRIALNNLIRKANEILDATTDDPKMQLQVINTLANLQFAFNNLNSEGNIIEQAYKKVQTLEEIQRQSSEEVVEEQIASESDVITESDEPIADEDRPPGFDISTGRETEEKEQTEE